MKRLSFEVENLLQKAREAAELAIETYNRPNAAFRSGAFTVLMIIAWTALCHAVFLRKMVKPYYRQKNSKRFERVDGEPRSWELSECVRRYFGSQSSPVRKNLEFFIALRNKIEHHSLSRLDPELFGECQAMILNFDQILASEFGDRYAIRGGLSYALQFGSVSQRPLRSGERKSYKDVKAFIETFRSNLSTEINSSLQYSFRVFLVPKISNHAANDTVAIEFVKYDPHKPEEMAKYERLVAMIKPRDVAVANAGMLKPTGVVKQVAVRLGRPFSTYDHQLCFQHFGVRPRSCAADPASCNTQFCVYDAVHKDYCYKPEWVEFLLNMLGDAATYQAIVGNKKKSGRAGVAPPPAGAAP